MKLGASDADNRGMNMKYVADIINGKPVVLLAGNLIEKGFPSLSDAQVRADELNKQIQG